MTRVFTDWFSSFQRSHLSSNLLDILTMIDFLSPLLGQEWTYVLCLLIYMYYLIWLNPWDILSIVFKIPILEMRHFKDELREGHGFLHNTLCMKQK